LWGAIYDISDADVEQLDKSEGYFPGRQKNSYWRRECTVLVGTQEQALTVATYFADPELNAPLPNQRYKDLIVQGARHWCLPSDYLAELEGIEVGQ